jgi:hypothetical protein
VQQSSSHLEAPPATARLHRPLHHCTTDSAPSLTHSITHYLIIHLSTILSFTVLCCAVLSSELCTE